MVRIIRIALAALILSVFIASAVTTINAARSAPVPGLTRTEYRASNPPAYAHSPYWSPAFEAAYESCAAIIPLADITWRGECHSRWINIDNGYRRTTDTPQQVAHTIWLFGNSNILGLEVPDNLTIASDLQRLMPNYLVRNMGVNAAISTLQDILLEQQPVRQGDIVILYGGIVDSNQLYNAEQRGDDKRQALTDLVTNYSKAIQHARAYTLDRGATFIDVLQPHVWTLSALTSAEVGFAPLLGTLGDATRESWPALQAADPSSLDLTHIYDVMRLSGTAIYLDGWHTNEIGNAAVARAIYDTIFPVF